MKLLLMNLIFYPAIDNGNSETEVTKDIDEDEMNEN